MKVMNGLDLQSQKIVNLADPSANTDAANKQYVDNVARGLQWKAPVRAAIDHQRARSPRFATAQTIDGVTLAANDRVLLKNQTTARENGIYRVWTPAVAPDPRGRCRHHRRTAPGTAVSVTEGTPTPTRCS